nr:AMP-binding protein [Microbacterium bovistercoris]
MLPDFHRVTRPRVDDETLGRWRAHGHRTDERIGWLLEERAATWPDRVAVVTPERAFTYGELQRKASAVARTLLTAGVQPGDSVCWMLPTDADAVAVASAIWRIGAVSSPIVPIYRTREMSEVIGQVRPAAVITDSDIRGRCLPDEFDEVFATVGHAPRARLLCRGIATGWRRADREGAGALPAAIQPASADQACLVLFTSGTEAAPKGAVHSVAGLTHEVRSGIAEWGITFRDRMFMASPMTHITGLLQGFLIPTRVGGAAVLLDRWDAAQAVEMIEHSSATYMAGATPFLRELLAAYTASGRDSSSLAQYCCGGAAVPSALIRSAQDFGITGYRAWGMTELPTSTVANELDSLEARSETDGRLAAGVELRVLDEDGSPLPPGGIGALQLRGPEMMAGYLDESLNEECFLDGGWFDTGDIGWVGEDGYVRVNGRTKEIINRGGEKFSVREIEELVARHPDVASVAVLAVPGGRLGERIGAVIVSRSGELTAEQLGDFLAGEGAAKQKRPEELALVDAIPTNSTGKVDKRAALALFDDGSEAG